MKIINSENESHNTNFCFALDEDYVWPLLVSIYSAKKYNIDLKKVSIIYDNLLLSEDSRFFIFKFLKKLDISVEFFSKQTPTGYIQKNHISKSSFLRLSAPSRIPGPIIYFDCDVLFLKNWRNITDFIAVIEKKNLPVAARKHWGQITSKYNRAIIESKNKYFNAGVLIFNVSSWSNKELDLKCEKAILEYSKLSFEFADQCVLNYALKGEYLEINQEFNSIPEEFCRRHTKLLHFAGPIKPWSFMVDTVKKEIILIKRVRLLDIPIRQWHAFIVYRKLETQVIKFMNRKNLLKE